jgi:hypothetical protein
MPRGKTITARCSICNKDISLFAYNRHVKSHTSIKSLLKKDPFIKGSCIYCEKVYNNRSGLSNHIRRCPKNPERVIEKMTPEGILKRNLSCKNRKWSEEQRLKQSLAMKKAVEKYPNSYTSANRGRTKQIIVNGIKLQGKWELEFYTWAQSQNFIVEKPSEGFKYQWQGERTYFPDFYIKSLDLYIEVKGYETERDRAKWLHFPNKLRIIRSEDIKKIREGTFKGL